MRVIDFLDAKDSFGTVLDAVHDKDHVITVRRSDVNDAVIMSLKNYSSLMETIYLLKSPANAAKSIAQYRASDIHID